MKAICKMIFVLANSLLLFACNSSNKVKNEKVKEPQICDCNLTDMEMREKYPISSINDSIVLCKIGKANGQQWIDILKNNQLHDGTREIYNCKKGEIIKPKYYSYSLSYANKSLVTFSNRLFNVFNDKTQKWVPGGLVVDVYKEFISSKNGEIFKTDAEFILNPPKYSKKALAEVNNLFIEKTKNPRISISEYLLGAALSGDKISRERLLNFEQHFPNSNELNNLDEKIEILNDFENYVKNGGKIKYLDLSVYGAFSR